MLAPPEPLSDLAAEGHAAEEEDDLSLLARAAATVPGDHGRSIRAGRRRMRSKQVWMQLASRRSPRAIFGGPLAIAVAFASSCSSQPPASPGGGATSSAPVTRRSIPTTTDDQGRQLTEANAAAREYCEMHHYCDLDALARPPVLGPVMGVRDGRRVTSYRWLGAGRGEDYVQVDIDAENGDISVSGARRHDAFPVWRKPRTSP